MLHYYDMKRYWTKRIIPHLNNKELNKILYRDFNKSLKNNPHRSKFFKIGMNLNDFHIADWDRNHRGMKPRYWKYTSYGACHYLVNFNLKLAQLAEPRYQWRILTSDKHSTVFNGKDIIFEMNFLAFGIPIEECYNLATEGEHARELKVGQFRKTYLPIQGF